MDNIRDLLILDEGISGTCYKCTSEKWTFAIGRNLEANPLKGEEFKFLLDNDKLEMKIDYSGAMYLLDKSLEILVIKFRRYTFYKNLDEVRQAVLIDMAYSMGLFGVLKFSKMIIAIKLNHWETAQEELEDSVFHRNLVLLKSKRSERLSLMMLTGAWPNVS